MDNAVNSTLTNETQHPPNHSNQPLRQSLSTLNQQAPVDPASSGIVPDPYPGRLTLLGHQVQQLNSPSRKHYITMRLGQSSAHSSRQQIPFISR